MLSREKDIARRYLECRGPFGPRGSLVSAARRATERRWVGWGLVAGAAALVPWMWVLTATMPSTTTVSNWSAAWVGLDAMEAAALLGTGALLLRRDPRYGLCAAVAGTLLAVDAWFDVMTATPGPARTSAIMVAAGLELPLAALCAALAARSFTQRGAMIDVPVNGDRQSVEGSAADG
ncbi:hypothetical protein [Actinomadura sp. BRA 177]|uniref:hypothetical protein n=1 Tax=Actinomadura sp. BRA 177 TaxID=2745202 RepID=UPI001595DD73|nr:hypothetical protein [Actinomadura sp. BRA 177]NVI87156.1 hypothetical protein [Actinomadura sp. BRA 177]